MKSLAKCPARNYNSIITAAMVRQDPAEATMDIELLPMTRARMHELYRGFVYDPDLFMDMALYERFRHYVYDPERVDALFDRREAEENRVAFAIMLGGAVIGEVALSRIDADQGECALSIHLKNDSVKNRGYGTRAEQLAVRYAFDQLGMDRVLADAIIKNTRSQRVLEKLGFECLGERDGFRQYRLERTHPSILSENTEGRPC